MSALGYYVPGDQTHIDIQFLPRLEGYIWVSALRASSRWESAEKGEPASSLRKRPGAVFDRARDRLEGRGLLQPFAAVARRGIVEENRVAGEGWMAVGDAAGLVDPVTGEAYTTPFARGPGGARVLSEVGEMARGQAQYGSRCGATSRPTWNSARDCQACVLGRFLFGSDAGAAWCSSRAAARILGHHTGPVRGQAAVPGFEAAPAAESERELVRHQYGPGVQPSGAAQGGLVPMWGQGEACLAPTRVQGCAGAVWAGRPGRCNGAVWGRAGRTCNGVGVGAGHARPEGLRTNETVRTFQVGRAVSQGVCDHSGRGQKLAVRAFGSVGGKPAVHRARWKAPQSSDGRWQRSTSITWGPGDRFCWAIGTRILWRVGRARWPIGTRLRPRPRKRKSSFGPGGK